MSRFTRSFLESALTGAQFGADVPTAFDVVQTDTRSLEAGALFVALVGDRFDAHTFVSTALENGAGACIVAAESASSRSTGAERGVSDDPRLIFVEDTLVALQTIAAAHLMRLRSRRVAITGSNGKTSTKELAAAALRASLPSGQVLATEGNLNNHIGLPLTALRADDAHEVVLLEMGMNHLGEIARLAEIARPEIGLVTNIGSAHAGNCGGIDGVARAKGELFQSLVDTDGTAIVNADDIRCMEQSKVVSRRVLFGWNPEADVRLLRAAPAPGGGIEMQLDVKGEQIDAFVPYEGIHNAHNAAAAIAIAVALKIDVKAAANGLAAATMANGRLTRKTAPNGATILDDTYNANPDSMAAGLSALASIAGARRRMAVLGEMLELDGEEEAHRALGALVASEGVDQLFVCGALGKLTADGALASGMNSECVTWAEDSSSLAPLVAEKIVGGDAVLIKGSRGSRMERVVDAVLSLPTPGGDA